MQSCSNATQTQNQSCLRARRMIMKQNSYDGERGGDEGLQRIPSARSPLLAQKQCSTRCISVKEASDAWPTRAVSNEPRCPRQEVTRRRRARRGVAFGRLFTLLPSSSPLTPLLAGFWNLGNWRQQGLRSTAPDRNWRSFGRAAFGALTSREQRAGIGEGWVEELNVSLQRIAREYFALPVCARSWLVRVSDTSRQRQRSSPLAGFTSLTASLASRRCRSVS
ncbi:hypothetical protein K438DRAFT_1977337 [Mycena galopus ATCC 62051]|nr:hypothetical protein K438DRAFT_1977337 [Mycena galopus ATCC 62051]